MTSSERTSLQLLLLLCWVLLVAQPSRAQEPPPGVGYSCGTGDSYPRLTGNNASCAVQTMLDVPGCDYRGEQTGSQSLTEEETLTCRDKCMNCCACESDFTEAQELTYRLSCDCLLSLGVARGSAQHYRPTTIREAVIACLVSDSLRDRVLAGLDFLQFWDWSELTASDFERGSSFITSVCEAFQDSGENHGSARCQMRCAERFPKLTQSPTPRETLEEALQSLNPVNLNNSTALFEFEAARFHGDSGPLRDNVTTELSFEYVWSEMTFGDVWTGGSPNTEESAGGGPQIPDIPPPEPDGN